MKAVVFTLLSTMMAISITQTKDVMSTCHLDIKTKAQFNKLFPMLQTLGVDVLKTKQKIITKGWLNDSYETANVQLSTMRRPQTTNKTSLQNTLEVNRRILKAFLPNMSKFKRQFGAFVVAREVTHQVQEIGWKARNIINFIQAIENAIHKLAQPSTAVIRPIISSAINTTRTSHGISTTSIQNPASARPPSTILALHNIALQASALLDDLYSNIVTMQVDFLKVSKTTCPTK